MPYEKVFLLVLDGAGIGQAPDAEAFGDAGSDTIGNVQRQLAAAGRTNRLPVLARLGLGCLYADGLPGLNCDQPCGQHTRLTEVSAGKDTTTGHWEMMGLPRSTASPTFPQGFPQALLNEIGSAAGCGWIGNKVASGTQIIQELGAEHLATGKLIVYTSADSVFQVAAHSAVVGIGELYRICEIARGLLNGTYAVDRVIARPFEGSTATGFQRTPDRKDFSLLPPAPTVLDEILRAGLAVIAVGKISDIYAGKGISRSYPVHGNTDVGKQVAQLAQQHAQWRGLCFANFVDFDMQYGHRNDVAGFAAALAAFDAWLGELLEILGPRDLLMVTADHGNDPTSPSTDHSREQVPLLLYSAQIAAQGGRKLAAEPGLYQIGATVAAALGLSTALPGQSLIQAGNVAP